MATNGGSTLSCARRLLQESARLLVVLPAGNDRQFVGKLLERAQTHGPGWVRNLGQAGALMAG